MSRGVSTVIEVRDHGMWRGRHSWTVVLEDDDGRSAVSAYGNTSRDAILDARSTFESRRIWTPQEREAMQRNRTALERGLFKP